MRLWTLHPVYLDAKGLLAAWREGLLAQMVLEGGTRGYTHHPQLDRFRDSGSPLECISRYLESLAAEADARGYRFSKEKIHRPSAGGHGSRIRRMPVSDSQISYEAALLSAKLSARDPDRLRSPEWLALSVPGAVPRLNPVFRAIPGGIAPWERVRDDIVFPSRLPR